VAGLPLAPVNAQGRGERGTPQALLPGHCGVRERLAYIEPTLWKKAERLRQTNLPRSNFICRLPQYE
jgi:hypothetical protein